MSNRGSRTVKHWGMRNYGSKASPLKHSQVRFMMTLKSSEEQHKATQALILFW